MRLELNTQMGTQLAMTPQLSQAIGIMKMTSDELEEFLYEIQISNPLIEMEDYGNFKEKKIKRLHNEININNLNKKIEVNKTDSLLQEFKLIVDDPKEFNLIKKVIMNLNNNGYLPNAYDFLTPDEYAFILDFFSLNGYVGLATLDLKHFLKIQCLKFYPDDELLLNLVDHIDLIAEKKWRFILKKFKITDDILSESIKKIQNLNPRPYSFVNDETNFILPDVIVRIRNKQIIYTLCDWFSPNLNINSYSLINLSKEENKQIQGWKNEAKWVVQALEQRKNTMRDIMEFLIKYQQEAFLNDLSYIKPLTLKDVSNYIGKHESTVSRAIMNKYIQINSNLYAFKDLFTSKLEGNAGEIISKEKIKWLLKELIDNEDKLVPLSDQKLATVLSKNESITISRRTITKYREELQIAPSSKRKSLKIINN